MPASSHNDSETRSLNLIVVAAWHNTVKAGGSRETRTLAGRRRAWNETPRITALYNTPVQGTAADITKKALASLLQRLVDTGAKIIGTVHDEIILEVPERTAREAAVILKETMIEAGKAYLSKVPVEVEVTIGETWAEK
jgi:DNA polymerase-1